MLTRVALTACYVLLLTPFALAVRAIADPMRFAAPPAWLPRDATGGDPTTRAKRRY
jgi:hypothetical protein